MAIRFALPSAGKISKFYLSTENEVKQFTALGYKVKPRRSGGQWVVCKDNKPWEIFEEDVRLFFKHGMALEDCGGGTAFTLGGNQIDACGGVNDVYIVAECKSKETLGGRTLRADLQMLYAKKKSIFDDVQAKFGSHYKRGFFVLVLRNLTPSQTDIAYATEHRIALWSERYFESLRSLYFTIGTRVRFYVIKELGAEPPLIAGAQPTISFPALECFNGSDRIYTTFIPANILLDIAYVLRIESEQKQAYQRLLDRKRLRDIARYIEDGNTFKNSIVVALDNDVTFVPSSHSQAAIPGVRPGELRMPARYASAWIIDGQHRLYGFARVNQDLMKSNLPVVALKSASKAEDAQTFVDINKNQKAVDPSLLWTLLGELDPYSREGLISDLVRLLDCTKGSMLRNKIFIPDSSKHPRNNYGIYQSNLCETIASQLISKRMPYPVLPQSVDAMEQKSRALKAAYATLNRYFKFLCAITSVPRLRRWQNDFFFTNNGANIMIRILAHILEYKHGKFTAKEIASEFGPTLGKFLDDQVDSIDTMRQRASSEGTRAKEAYRFLTAISADVKGFANASIRKQQSALEGSEPYKTLKLIEESLRDLVSTNLGSLNDRWWLQRVPQDVRENAEARKERREAPWPWMDAKPHPAHYYVDFADYKKIIRRSDNWNAVFKKHFPYSEWVEVKLREIEPIRNDVAHNRDLSQLQLRTLHLFSQQLDKIRSGSIANTDSVLEVSKSEDTGERTESAGAGPTK